MIIRPMNSREVASRIGVSLDCFYKNRERYRMIDGMPAPISGHGRMAWERTGMEAWLTRHHPMRPPMPANDPVRPPDAATDDEHRLRLARAYAPIQPASGLDRARRRA